MEGAGWLIVIMIWTIFDFGKYVIIMQCFALMVSVIYAKDEEFKSAKITHYVSLVLSVIINLYYASKESSISHFTMIFLGSTISSVIIFLIFSLILKLMINKYSKHG